jgi:hypothetical protein
VSEELFVPFNPGLREFCAYLFAKKKIRKNTPLLMRNLGADMPRKSLCKRGKKSGKNV